MPSTYKTSGKIDYKDPYTSTGGGIIKDMTFNDLNDPNHPTSTPSSVSFLKSTSDITNGIIVTFDWEDAPDGIKYAKNITKV